jgi:energy-coupling factor transporter ATP-binding protein EcfA2
MIDEIAQRFERKLVVTLVGPSGSGKSTLLNVLAGIDDLSPAGHRRPTTGNIIIFSSHGNDAKQLAENLGGNSVEIRSNTAAVFLKHVLLIDTPDTDSRAYKKHYPLVHKAVSQSDMLVCIFDAENPKRRDHADFLAPFVEKFDGESLVGVLNKCDRLDEQELKDRILPDFAKYIRAAWQGKVDRILCISARRHLNDPHWDDSADPRHQFDQFEELRELVFRTINHAGYVVDRRLENVMNLKDYVNTEVNRELSKNYNALIAAKQQIEEAQKKALMKAAAAMRRDDSKRLLGINVVVYQKLSQMWIGPMGWMIAIWSRLLIFGSGITALFRFGRPIRRMVETISALRHFKDSSTTGNPSGARQISTALRNYRMVTMRHWPDIAENLIKGGFDSNVRSLGDALSGGDQFSEKLTAMWSEILEVEIDRVSQKLSGFFLQVLFNVPAIGILGYCGWLTLQSFFSGDYLSGDFFLHAFWAIGIMMLLSFFLLQMVIRLTAGTRRMTTRAVEKFKSQTNQIDTPLAQPVRSQLETLLGLTATAATGDIKTA